MKDARAVRIKKAKASIKRTYAAWIDAVEGFNPAQTVPVTMGTYIDIAWKAGKRRRKRC